MDAIVERMRETARGRGDSIGDVQRGKLIVDTDLKLLAKWSPKRYGDKIDVTQSNRAAPIRALHRKKRYDETSQSLDNKKKGDLNHSKKVTLQRTLQ